MTAGRINNSENKSWNTPPKYINPILEFFNGSIDLDPCSNETSLVPSKNKFILPTDGLKRDWNYRTIFVNPPYGRDSINKTSVYNWVEKAIVSRDIFNSEIVLLIPVATNTKHFKELIFKYANGICFLSDSRLKFYKDGEEDKKGAPMACCIIYVGFNNRYIDFYNVFSNYGTVFKI